MLVSHLSTVAPFGYLPLLVSFCLMANIFCSIVDILFKLGNNIFVSSGNKLRQFGKEQRKNEGDRKIESDLHKNQHKMRLES